MTLTTTAPVEPLTASPRAASAAHGAHGAGLCTIRLGGEGGTLQCTREAGHAPGCVFTSTSGVPDRHTLTSGE